MIDGVAVAGWIGLHVLILGVFVARRVVREVLLRGR